MAAIVYPAELPCPSAAPLTVTERRLLSSLPGPRQGRPMQRDFHGTQQLDFVFMSSAQLEAFGEWGDTVLRQWGAWFSSDWPMPDGSAGVRRFVARPRYHGYVPGIGWRVSAVCEVRGRGMQPQTPVFNIQHIYSRGGSNQNTQSFEPHSAGDCIVVYAKASNKTAPALPTGWTNILSFIPTFGNAGRYYYLIDTENTASAFVLPGNTNNIAYSIYRNVSTVGVSATKPEEIGGDVTSPALTGMHVGSWGVIGLSYNQYRESVYPINLTRRSFNPESLGGGASAEIFDTGGPVSSLAGQFFDWNPACTVVASAFELRRLA